MIKISTEVNQMKISVVIPTYAPGGYLFECLGSLENQSLSKDMFEVLIVLNGPKDPYYDSISEYISISKIMISLYYTADKGVSSARNIGLDKITSNYVAFIDDDDLLSPAFLQGLVAVAEKDTIVVSNFQAFTGEIGNMQQDYLADAYKNLKSCKKLTILNSRKFFSNVCGKLIPVSLIGELRFDTRISIGEDSVFIVEISKNVSQIRLASENSIYYRRMRPESASRKKINPYKLISSTVYQIGKYVGMGFREPVKYNIGLLAFKIFASIKSTTISLFCNTS